MARPFPGRTPVFHIIPIEKLRSVIEHGLLCDAEARDRFGDQVATDAAHAGLKAARREKAVVGPDGAPVAQGGTMDSYVPFYFGPRSPMLFAIKCGQTEYGRHGRGQRGMVHLALRLESLAQDHPDGWCFVDAHLTRAWARFGDTLEELDDWVDFGAMTAKFWNQPDELRAARQAEFLIHRVVPWEYVELIVVIDDEVEQEVAAVLEQSGVQHIPEVRVRAPGHYPDSPFPYGYYYQ